MAMTTQTTPMTDELLTIKQVGALLKLSRQALTTMRHKGRLPVTKIGRSVRVRRSTLDKLIQDGVQ